MAISVPTFNRSKVKKFAGLGILALKKAIEKQLKTKYASRNRPMPGRMYLYSYDALHKDTLPVWDALPLVIFIEFKKGGFTGLNVHYISFVNKFRLLKKLERIAKDDTPIKGKKVFLSYNLLKTFSFVKDIETGFKRYRFDRLKSRFVEIPYSDWKYIVHLPVAQWHKNKKK